MKLSTRLVLSLVATVVVVMAAYAVWAQQQRERTVRSEAERETRAYATALALALERVVEDPDPAGLREIVARVGREPAIYGVLVYDPAGATRYVSPPLADPGRAPEAVVRAADGTSPSTLVREVDGDPVVSVVRTLAADDGRVSGILEVVQPLASVAAEQARIRQRFVLNTLTLLIAMAAVVVWLVRRHLSVPLDRFTGAVRALGQGDLSHRIETKRAAGELREVAVELNRMADRLQAARTELLTQNEERLMLERRLRQSETMAKIGTLAAGLAHEIGAPLHVIRGRADLLRKRHPHEGELQRNLGIVIDQIDRISKIVTNLLGFARRREPRPRRVDLSAVVADVVAFVEGEAERRAVGLDFEPAAEPIEVEADPDLLQQVVLNLVLNALHAVEAPTGVSSSSAPSPDERPRVAVAVGADGPNARVDVVDSGPGIAPDLRDRVFDPFFTTRAGRGGTGLGLAVARAVVEDHGGTIEIVPPGEGRAPGAHLRVVLPLLEIPGE